MPGITFTTTSSVLLAAQAQLAVVTGLDPSVVYVVGDLSPPKFQATRILQLWPQDWGIDGPVDIGAGRFALRMTEMLWVVVCTQLMTDDMGRALQSFIDPVNGHYPLRSSVFNLHDFWPTDANGNALTVEPFKLTTGSRAENPQAPRYTGWTTSVVRFSMIYRQLLVPNKE